MQKTRNGQRASRIVIWLAVGWLMCGRLLAEDEKKPAQEVTIKQSVHRLTETAHTAKDFSQIIEQCQIALDGELSDSDRTYLRTLKSWALNRRCEKRLEFAADFAAAGNDRQVLLVNDEALADAMEAVALDETRWRAFLNRGILLSDAGLLPEAMADFQTVCRLQPKESAGWFNCGEMHSALNNYRKAVGSYDRALAIDSADLQALTGRGLAYCRLGDYAAAEKDFEIVVRMRGSDAAAFINRGDARLGLAQWRDAYDDYIRAAEIADNGLAAERTAWLFATCPEEEFYRPDTAVDLARHSIAQSGETVGNLEALAAAYACKGDFNLAVEVQRKAIAMDTSRAAARSERLGLYEKQKPFVQQVLRVDEGQMRTSTAEEPTDSEKK